MAQIQPTDTVLNVGCNNGYMERHLLRGLGASCFGVDADPQAIEFARRSGLSGLQDNVDARTRFQCSPAENLPFGDALFDKVLCLDTLEHVTNEKQALHEIHRVLKPGGTLVLSVPHDFMNFLDPDELTRGLRNVVRKVRNKKQLDHPRHRHYSEAQLRELLARFEVVNVHKCGTPVFWSLAMFYTAFGLPDKLTGPLRAVTNPIEDAEYALALPTGFNIMVKACKPS
ncbi:MAG: class I SAM-dependent methyltransferase [Deltaproteobacteria bacterium]|nr:class I SAM-dependent methyltransferase [Deltaproteobacteria bacterium]